VIEKTIQALRNLDFDYLDMYEKSAAEKERDLQVAELERVKRILVCDKQNFVLYLLSGHTVLTSKKGPKRARIYYL